jgi:hypothetical protein
MREPGEKAGGDPMAPDGRKESDGCFDMRLVMVWRYNISMALEWWSLNYL